MKKSRRMVANVVEIFIGVVLLVCHFSGLVDEFWNGMGAALVVVGVLQLLRQIKYQTNEAYRERVNVEAGDERNKYLAMKAWSWAGYLFVLIAAVATIVFKILGEETLVTVASGSLCLVIVLYWGSYLFLRKKY